MQPLQPQHIASLQKIFDSNSYIYTDAGLDYLKNAQDIFANPQLPKHGKIENDRKYCVFNQQNEMLAYINYYVFYRDKPVIYIADLFVDSSRHRTGIGRSIMRELEAVWKQDGITHAVLNVFFSNFDALNFWVNIGYIAIKGTIPATSEATRDAMIRLEKTL